MKKLSIALFSILCLVFAGCFETKEEIDLRENGTGVYTTTNDMSSVIGLAKQMGGKEAEKIEDVKKDTTIFFVSLLDSMQFLEPAEKALIKGGTMHMNVDLKNDKFVITMKFPFTQVTDIPTINKIAGKLMTQTLKDKLTGEETKMLGDMPEPSTFDSYYNISYASGLITKTLNKEKYGGVESDEYLKGMKEAGSMGIPITNTQVINLPRPAKKVDGKHAKLSDDKMKVTIKSDIEEFFDDPEKLEFRIEY